MRILVTGGAGFIASHIVDAYVAAGHTVFVIDNESSGKKSNVNHQAHYTRLDVTDRKKIARYFQNKRFDIVNHHAAQIDVRRSVQDPIFDANVNIFGLLNILEACRLNKVKKIIFSASGGTVYGECTRPALESSPEVPLSPYGVAKLASEKYIKTFAALHGLTYTIFRYANVYGPRQDPHGEAGVVAIFSQNLLKGKTSFVFGSGKQTRDFVYVGDVAKANLLALTKGKNSVINIGTAKETSVRELYTIMADLMAFRERPIHKPARAGELNRSIVAISTAKRLLGWRPAHSLREGLSETIQYFQHQMERR